MGICCTGKQSKSEYRNDEIIKPNSMPKEVKSNNASDNAGINYEIQHNTLNINISQLITTTTHVIMNPSPQFIEENDYNLLNNNNKNSISLPLDKTNLEYLWNVFIEHKDDFTACNIINLDLRRATPENFLKKMKKINYSIEEMLQMNSDKIKNFKRYLGNKTVIVILENDMVVKLSTIIQFFIEKQFNISSLKILNSNLNCDFMSTMEKYIYSTLDQSSCDNYPFILLSFRYLSHIKTDNFIFFQKVNMAHLKNSSQNKFTPEYLSNSQLGKEDPYLTFWNNFRMNLILRVSNGAFSEATSEFKRCKTDNAAKTSNSILSCVSFTSIQERPKALNGIFEKVKQEINMKQSIILQIDEAFTEEVVFEFLLLLIMKVTSLPIHLVIEYLSLNVAFIRDAKSLYSKEQKEITEILNIYGFN